MLRPAATSRALGGQNKRSNVSQHRARILTRTGFGLLAMGAESLVKSRRSGYGQRLVLRGGYLLNLLNSKNTVVGEFQVLMYYGSAGWASDLEASEQIRFSRGDYLAIVLGRTIKNFRGNAYAIGRTEPSARSALNVAGCDEPSGVHRRRSVRVSGQGRFRFDESCRIPAARVTGVAVLCTCPDRTLGRFSRREACRRTISNITYASAILTDVR